MHPLLKLFSDFSEKEGFAADSFIVGGAVRDIILGKELKDIDITVKGDAVNIARKFAEKINASFVLLDKDFGIVRVVKNTQFIDICLMRGNAIYDDLSDRDITINAMAIPLKNSDKLQVTSDKLKDKNSLLVAYYSLLNVIDPYNGFYDLTHKIIRMVSEENLIKDPLRILRIYRFAPTLHFSIEKNTLEAAKRLSSLITSTAVERIAEELRYIVRLDDSYKTMKDMMDNRIFAYIFPEVKINSLKLYKAAEQILSNLSDSLQPLIKYFEIDCRKICLKLSTLFHAPEEAKQSAIRLKMSKREVDFIYKMVFNRNKILNFYKEMQGMADETNIIGLLKQFRDDVYPSIILAIAQKPSVIAFCKEVINIYENAFKPRAALLPIITGNDLIMEFNLKPSPVLKKILAAIEHMVLEGKITAKEEALKIANKML